MLTFDSLRLASPYYNDNHAEWRSQLRKFVEREIMPHVDDWEEACDLPQALWHTAVAAACRPYRAYRIDRAFRWLVFQ